MSQFDCYQLQLVYPTREHRPARNVQHETSKTTFFKKNFYLFIFTGRGKEGEREGEKHQSVVASCAPATGDLDHNPGMCPDWESNWQPFDLQVGTQSVEPHQPGLQTTFDTFNPSQHLLHTLQKGFFVCVSVGFLLFLK